MNAMLVARLVQVHYPLNAILVKIIKYYLIINVVVYRDFICKQYKIVSLSKNIVLNVWSVLQIVYIAHHLPFALNVWTLPSHFPRDSA